MIENLTTDLYIHEDAFILVSRSSSPEGITKDQVRELLESILEELE